MGTSKFTQELADAICADLADGKSLREICRAENMPSEAVVRLWALDNTGGFSAQYARARAIGYERLAEDIIAISDTPQEGVETTVKADGTSETKHGDMLGHRKLQVDTRKWMLSKMLPKVYGDKLTHQGDTDNPLQVITKIERVIVRPANTNG